MESLNITYIIGNGMNFKTQREGNFCKVCKKSTHDLPDHMKTDHYGLS